jgi:hypothetical protein
VVCVILNGIKRLYSDAKRRRKMKGVYTLTKMMILAIILLCFSFQGNAADIVAMPDLLNPDSISLDENNIYITENATIYIYGIKDFKLKKKFGEIGQGPGEFMGDARTTRAPLVLYVRLPDTILVNSFGKISYFSQKGEFIKDLRRMDTSSNFRALGSGFAGTKLARQDNIQYRTLNIYDSKLKKVKEIFRVLHPLAGRRFGFRVFEAPMVFATYQDKLFVSFEEDFIIRVFDASGKELYSITQEYKRRKVTEADRQTATRFVKTNPRFHAIRSILLPLHFPQDFPALKNIIVNDDKVYAITERNENDDTQCYIFDLKGKLLGKKVVDILNKDEFDVFVYTIKNGKIYQLVEEEGEENWNLIVTEIK